MCGVREAASAWALGGEHGAEAGRAPPRVVERAVGVGHREQLDRRPDAVPRGEVEHLRRLDQRAGLAADHAFLAAEEAERLKEALEEHAPEAAEELAESTSVEGPSANRFEKMINIRDQGQIFRVDVDTIERIDAAGDYMCIQTAGNTLILRETMKDLEKRLDPRRFQRVHRSTIVNLDLVKQVKPHTNGECFLVLESGAQIKVSRSYRDVVARFVH